MKIEQRLAQVKRALVAEGIGKGGTTNFGGKYKYRKVEDVMAIVSSLHAKHGVNFSIQKIDHFNVDKAGNEVHMHGLFTMRFSSSDNKDDFIEHVCIGEGYDKGDKASGKMHSYAYKNGMFSHYEIPVEGQGDDFYDPRIDNEDDSKPESESTPMPKNVKDEVDKFKGDDNKSPGQNMKEHRDKKKEEAKSEQEAVEAEQASDIITDLQSKINALKLYVEDEDNSISPESGEQVRSNLVSFLNTNEKKLGLSKAEDEGIRGLLVASRKKIDSNDVSQNSNAIAELARNQKKKLEA